MLSFQKADTGLERWLRKQAHTCYTDIHVDETLIHIKETLKSHEKCRHKQQPGRRFKCNQLGGALDGRQHWYGDSWGMTSMFYRTVCGCPAHCLLQPEACDFYSLFLPFCRYWAEVIRGLRSSELVEGTSSEKFRGIPLIEHGVELKFPWNLTPKDTLW